MPEMWKNVIRLCLCAFCIPALAAPVEVTLNDTHTVVLQAGHESLKEWLLPGRAPSPVDNAISPTRVALGQKLFFDVRLSGKQGISCANCHDPDHGWADERVLSFGFHGMILMRNTPTIVNSGFNKFQMWDGRFRTLEAQALAPIASKDEMNAEIDEVLGRLRKDTKYKTLFAQAYPGEGITSSTLARALAAFERTVVSNNSPFDRWVSGDDGALSAHEINGFRLFLDPKKGNCAGCHAAPNFTDDGFHNIGLASFGARKHDTGRFSQRALKILDGAFKTPTLREVASTGPWFHDGSADSLAAVIEHYKKGGVEKSNLSPEFKDIELSRNETSDLLAFLRALSGPADKRIFPDVKRRVIP